MGNEASVSSLSHENHHKTFKFNDRKNKKHFRNRHKDDFIIKLHQQQIENGMTASDEIQEILIKDQRRLVFVSLIGLYISWRQCPTLSLYSSIFILPLSRKWIYSPKKYQSEIQRHIVGQSSTFKDKTELHEFMTLLRWKDGQNLIFWMLDGFDSDSGDINKNNNSNTNNNNKDGLIAPFWANLSDKLCELYDPVTRSKYKPLLLEDKWWQFSYNKVVDSKYNVKTHRILSELYFLTMKYKSIQEIIYQSNPDSLNPIISYHEYLNSITQPELSKNPSRLSNKSNSSLNSKSDYYGFSAFQSIDDDIHDENDENPHLQSPDPLEEDEEDDGVWFMSDDYDENEQDDHPLDDIYDSERA